MNSTITPFVYTLFGIATFGVVQLIIGTGKAVTRSRRSFRKPAKYHFLLGTVIVMGAFLAWVLLSLYQVFFFDIHPSSSHL